MPVYSLQPAAPGFQEIEVQVQSRLQIPSFQMLGLPSKEILEARERIIAAFESSGFTFPRRRVVVNLSPPDLPKSGTHYDLAVAVAILMAGDSRWRDRNFFAWGELNLDGEVRPKGWAATWLDYFLHREEKREASDISVATWLAHPDDAQVLKQLIQWRQQRGLKVPKRLLWIPFQNLQDFETLSESMQDLAIETTTPSAPAADSVLASSKTKQNPVLPPISSALLRWLKIAMVGQHHWLLLGSKGAGKSSVLHWISALACENDPQLSWERMTLFRHLSQETATPVQRIHAQNRPANLLGYFKRDEFVPGDLLCAHGGILIADEFPEWPRDSKECLREPLEEERVTLTRRGGRVNLPCRLQWVGTGNLCPCGGIPAHLPHLDRNVAHSCRCTPDVADRYLRRLGGPILDRLDVVTLIGNPADSHSLDPVSIRLEIYEAQKKLIHYFNRLPRFIGASEMERMIHDQPVIAHFLQSKKSMSFRSRHKMIRMACSIAALDQKHRDPFSPDQVTEAHLIEAWMGRPESWLFRN